MTTVLESLNSALKQALADDPRVVILGEDVLDPYGGAFKVTRGLSEAFPGRVLATPISEAGFTGLATGMALRGLHPVVEIMFGDFLTLAADALINHAAKFRWMYGGADQDEAPSVPLVVRAPMGGRRGYGPTHSQTLEKHFLGTPGLHVLAACAFDDPGKLLYQAIRHTHDPALYIENKLLYLLPLLPLGGDAELDVRADRPEARIDYPLSAPTYTVKVRGGASPALTLTAYGYMAELARQAIIRLAYEYEIFTELIVPTRLAPFDAGVILESVGRTGRLVTAEEGSYDLGWGAEIAARVAEAHGTNLKAVRRVAAANLPVPASVPLENKVLPSVDRLVESCIQCVQCG